MNTKIIGHRGAAGLALENTTESFKKAMELDIDFIEFDVRLTKDRQLVVHHYENLITESACRKKFRLALYKFIQKAKVLDDSKLIARLFKKRGDFLRLKNHTLNQLRSIRLLNGTKILTLEETLRLTGDMPVIIETKDYGTSDQILQSIKNFPDKHIRVASFKVREVAKLRKPAPELFLYGLEHLKLTDIVTEARRYKLNGIGMNFWLLNPLTYRLAIRSGLDIYIYTFNLRWLTRIIIFLYPKISICSDHPEWFLDLRQSSQRKTEPTV